MVVNHPMGQIHDDKCWLPLLLDLLLYNSLILWFENLFLVFEILVIEWVVIENPLSSFLDNIAFDFLDLVFRFFSFVPIILFAIPNHVLELPMLL